MQPHIHVGAHNRAPLQKTCLLEPDTVIEGSIEALGAIAQTMLEHQISHVLLELNNQHRRTRLHLLEVNEDLPTPSEHWLDGCQTALLEALQLTRYAQNLQHALLEISNPIADVLEVRFLEL
jgi:hypothetical protein